MRRSVLGFESGKLLRGAAIGMIAALGAGCSSDFSRFAPYDSVSTGSVNQSQIIFKNKAPVAPQPYPDDVSASADEINQPVYTGTVEDGMIKPAKAAVKKTTLAPVAAASAPAAKAAIKKAKTKTLEPVSAARQAVTEETLPLPEKPKAVAIIKKKAKSIPLAETDETVTGSVAAPKQARLKPKAQPMPDDAPVKQVSAKEPAQEGWSTIGGTWITVKDGETVYNLAKRFGVPANAILEANGLSNAAALQAGKKVIIPTYIYSNSAKVSAPDANADTQLAKSSHGSVTDVDQKKVPLPGKAPAKENVAVLPNVPTTKVKKPVETLAASDAAAAQKKAEAARLAAAKPAAIKPAASAPGTYTVASGDSLYVIAKKTGSTVDAIKAANGMSDAKLKIGQVLKVPAAGAASATVVAAAEPIVDPIETGTAVATPKKLPVEAAAPAATEVAAPSNAVIEEAEKDTAAAPSATGISKLRWPVRGRTLVGYGQADAGRVNDGVDISVPVGTPVKAAENGVVIYAGTGLKDFGNTVLIRHEDGMVTVYGHNGDLMVKRGQSIKRGQEIARSGMSGTTKVPKLHFEVRKNSKPVNPATYLE
ncbi:MAG: peptidoglycan DD-metalloendopeptidase family protein [Rhizobiaceae bacterium]